MPNMMTYNPAQVMMGRSASSPYLDTGPDNMASKGWGLSGRGGGFGFANNQFSNPSEQGGPVAPPSPVLGAEAVRASGSGPFDAAYRQNLATYAGGQMARPGGSLSFDPTGSADNFPTGPSLLEQALGGGGWSAPQPTPAQQSAAPLGWQDWLKMFRDQGGMFGGGGLTQRELMQ